MRARLHHTEASAIDRRHPNRGGASRPCDESEALLPRQTSKPLNHSGERGHDQAEVAHERDHAPEAHRRARPDEHEVLPNLVRLRAIMVKPARPAELADETVNLFKESLLLCHRKVTLNDSPPRLTAWVYILTS